MENALISVIVPVYNVENYIRDCLDSLLSQSYTNFELILVDDGSTDRSGDICDEYSEKDDRINVIHKENGGLSSARNAGLDVANGKFICFVDSDDTVTRNYLEKLYRVIVNCRVDMSFSDIESSRLQVPLVELANKCGNHRPQGEKNQDENELNNEKNYILSSDEAWNLFLDPRTREYVLMVVAWNKLYKKELFDGLRFPEGRFHEDEFMTNYILDRVKRIAFIPDKLYIYRDNSAGITGNDNKSDLRHLDVIEAYDERIQMAINRENRAFAQRTLINAFLKLIDFCGESDAMKVLAMEKYRTLYTKYLGLLSLKQRLKYRLFIIFPKVFHIIFC